LVSAPASTLRPETTASLYLRKGKLTFAATPERVYVFDFSIAELEHKLDPARFVRIERVAALKGQLGI